LRCANSQKPLRVATRNVQPCGRCVYAGVLSRVYVVYLFTACFTFSSIILLNILVFAQEQLAAQMKLIADQPNGFIAAGKVRIQLKAEIPNKEARSCSIPLSIFKIIFYTFVFSSPRQALIRDASGLSFGPPRLPLMPLESAGKDKLLREMAGMVAKQTDLLSK